MDFINGGIEPAIIQFLIQKNDQLLLEMKLICLEKERPLLQKPKFISDESQLPGRKILAIIETIIWVIKNGFLFEKISHRSWDD